jgi:hypothetical protein
MSFVYHHRDLFFQPRFCLKADTIFINSSLPLHDGLSDIAFTFWII